MKDNVVFWGANSKDEKILVALRLRAADKKVDIWTFPENVCRKEFLDQMFGDWDKLETEKFPETHEYIERDASSSELLPNEIKTSTPENADLISRAEKEWFVKVLSLRLYEMIKSEVLALKEQVWALKEYDKSYWDSCKAYWEKIMNNLHDHNLNREQASELREVVNSSFERLKELMADSNKQYEEESQANFFQLSKKIEAVNAAFEKNPNSAKKQFNDLRKIQDSMKGLRLSHVSQKELRSKLNKSFEKVKKGLAASNAGRNEKRIAGLKQAIQKLSGSIDYDKKSIEFQNRRSNSVHAGQLEMQLREAKVSMINARIESKQAKVDDMQRILKDLEKKAKKAAPKTDEKKEPVAKKSKKKAKQQNKPEENAKVAAVKSDASKADAPKADAPKADARKADAPKADAPKADALKTDAPKADAAKADAPKADAPKADAPKADAPKVETPKAEKPKTETPKADAPKAEAPKVEAPKVEVPKTEAPKTEAPKTEVSKVETPKAESPERKVIRKVSAADKEPVVRKAVKVEAKTDAANNETSKVSEPLSTLAMTELHLSKKKADSEEE